MGKRGVGYLLSEHGVGGQLTDKSICAAFGAAPHSGATVYEPGKSRLMSQRV